MLTESIQDIWASLEEDTSGVSAVELEHEWYARLGGVIDKLGHSGSEFYSQYEMPRFGHDDQVRGRLRVRKVVRANGKIEYLMAIKRKTPEGPLETALEITEGVFSEFKALSDSGVEKRRYFFPVDGTEGTMRDGPFDGRLVFEVDVFMTSDGAPHEWVKIDLEHPAGLKDIPPFPFEVKDIIKSTEKEKRDQIQNLYKDYSRVNTEIKRVVHGE